MPNWCENEVMVNGKKNDIQALKEHLSQGKNDLEFMFVLPPPNNEWNYNWCIQNWGTKWEPEHVDADWHEDTVTFYFWSAWAPAVGIVNALAQKFPALHWEYIYAESGMDFSGRIEWENGEITINESGAYGEWYGEPYEEEEEEDE